MPVRSELAVPGPRWARVATDGVALAGVASFVAAFWFDGVVVALFALVLLGLVVPRVLGMPGVLQAGSGATLVLGAWGATLDWYVAVPWLDIVVHAAANGLLAAVALELARRSGTLPRRLPASGVVVVTTALGALLAVVWEAGEWFGHTLLDDAIQVGYTDTVGDLVCGTLGSLVVGLALAAGGPPGSRGAQVRAGVGAGRHE